MEGVKIKLRSSEGQIFEVEEDAACLSLFIKNTIEGFGEVKEIPLPNISSVVLEKIVDYMNYYKDKDPIVVSKPIKSSLMEEIVPAWDTEFIDIDKDDLTKLLVAADYLMISPLRELCCAKVATLFRGSSIDDLRANTEIREEFTPEIEEQLSREDPWKLESERF